MLPSSSFEVTLSVPLYVEYQSVLHRPGMVPSSLSRADIDAICRFIASVSHPQRIFFLWRPLLPDPKDGMVAELAIASRSRYIVTHNVSDFGPADTFGIEAIRPRDFLHTIQSTP